MNRLDRFALLLAACAFPAACLADPAPNHYDEPGFNPGRDYVNQHFSEHIDPFSGNLQLHYIDVFIPGNGGFDIKVQRSYNLMNAVNGIGTDSPFGNGWDIHFGRVHYQLNQSTCNYATSTPNTLVLELPDGSQQALYKQSTVAGTTSNEFITLRLWKATCDTASGGIFVTSPDGTRYEMTTRDLNRNTWLATRIVDRNGNTATIAYTTLSSVYGLVPSTVSVGGSALVTFNYNGPQGWVTSITSQGRIWQYTIDTVNSRKRLKTVQPPNGGVWNYTYYGDRGSAAGSYALQRVTYPTTGTIDYDYQYVNFFQGVLGPQRNTVVTRKAAGGDVWTYAYNPSAGSGSYDQTTVTQPDSIGTIVYKHFGYGTVSTGSVWKIGLLAQKSIDGSLQVEDYTWDTDTISMQSITRPGYGKTDGNIQRPRLLTRTIRRDGANYTTTYSNPDLWGNAQQVTESGSQSRTHNYSFKNDTTAWILGLQESDSVSSIGTISRTFDASGNMRSETRYGVTTTFDYNGDGSVRSRTNARQRTTSFSNYTAGVPGIENRPESVTINRDVDQWGNVLQESNGEATWNYRYDDLNRLIFVDYPVGTDANISWLTGNPSSRNFVRGTYRDETDFDAYGRVIARERGDILIQYRYDALGRKTFESLPDSAGGTTSTLDALGRVKSTTSPHGSTSRSYGANSMTVTNERGKTTTYRYQRFGNPDEGSLTAIESPAGTSIAMTRDLAGNLKSANQGGVPRGYDYDNSLFLVRITDPETGDTIIERDPVGNMSAKTVGGRRTTYQYDDLDRLETIAYPGTTGNTTFEYYKRGLLKTVANPSATRTYTYDDNGNLKQDQLVTDGQTFTTTYDYSALDGLQQMTYPSQMGTSPRTVTFSPDSLGRPQAVSPFINSVTYRNSGNLAGVSYANGVGMTFGEDAARLLPNSVSATIGGLNLDYTYDGVGNVKTIRGSEDSDLTYDDADRLTGASGSGTSIAYSGSGNILSKIQSDGTVVLNYETAKNRVSSVSINGATAKTFSYDVYGNVTKNDRNTLSYDDASALTCVDCGTANEIRYAYDGKGWRVWQIKNGRKTFFQHAANGDLLFEFTPGATAVENQWKQHVYLAGKRIATRANDLIPTTIALTDVRNAQGEQIALRATVTPSAATGIVKFVVFESGGADIPLVNGVATWDLSQASMGGPAEARYLGDNIYAPSGPSNNVNVTTKRLPQVTMLTDPSPPVSGQGYSVNGVVSGNGGGGIPTGTVEFTVDGSPPISTTLNAGAYSFPNRPPLGDGSHTLSAHYLGDATYKQNSATLTFSLGPPNVPPTVTVTAPSDGATLLRGQAVTLSASAADSDGTVSSVTFVDMYQTSAVDLVPVSTPPAFSIQWTPTTAGVHSLTARAVDNRNGQGVSSPVTVTVVCPAGNVAPTVSITSPTAGQSFDRPIVVELAATASDTDGTVAKVEFFADATKIGEVLSAPYSFYWQAAPGGTFNLTAKVTDDCGASTTSAPVQVTVIRPVGFVNGNFESPAITAYPWRNASPTSSGWTPGVNVFHTLYFYLPGLQRYNAPEGNQFGAFVSGNTTSQTVWLPAGDWQLRFHAMRPLNGPVDIVVLKDGAPFYQASLVRDTWTYHVAPVISLAEPQSIRFEFTNSSIDFLTYIYLDDVIIGPPQQPPTVTLATPATGDGATITLSANASDSDGWISKVEFLQSGMKIGERKAQPYSIEWSPPTSGTYTITARAYDNSGAATTSSAATISVTVPSAFANGGFEAPVLPPATDQPFPTSGAGWTPSGDATLTTLANTSNHAPLPPEGRQDAYFGNTGALQQTLMLPAGTYAVTFKAWANWPNAVVNLRMGVQSIAAATIPWVPAYWSSVTSQTFTITSPRGQPVSTSFLFSMGTTSGQIFIDDVRLNQPPTATVTLPVSGQSFFLGQAIPLAANAVDPEGDIRYVKFLDGTNELATVLWPPYEYSWTSATQGSHTITAQVVDGAGLTATSAPIPITVTCAPGNLPPAVNLTSPTAGQTFAAPASVTMTATAGDSDGTITKVEFYQGTTKVGEAAQAPYTFLWTSVPAGSYSLTAKAIDNCNDAPSSSAVPITVSAPPMTFTNGGFESPTLAAGTQVPMTNAYGWIPTGPVFTAEAGVLTALGKPAPPEGHQLAILRTDAAASIGQSVFLPAGNYKLSFKALSAGSASATVQVLVNSAPLFSQSRVSTSAWTTYTSPATFTVPAGGAGVRIDLVASVTATNYIWLDDVKIIPQ